MVIRNYSECFAVQVRTELADSPYKCEAFTLSDRIVAFGVVQKATGIRYHSGATCLSLDQDSSYAMPTCISTNFCRCRIIEMGQNRTTGQTVNERGKSRGLCGAPRERGIGLQKIRERAGYVSEVLDEAAEVRT